MTRSPQTSRVIRRDWERTVPVEKNKRVRGTSFGFARSSICWSTRRVSEIFYPIKNQHERSRVLRKQVGRTARAQSIHGCGMSPSRHLSNPPPPTTTTTTTTKWSALISIKLLLQSNLVPRTSRGKKTTKGKALGTRLDTEPRVLGLQVPEVLWDIFSCGFDSDE